MVAQVFTIHATTNSNVVFDGSSNTIAGISGIMYLASDMWSGYIDGASPENNIIRVPKGCDLKIWESTLYGIPATVAVMASSDTGSNYQTVKADMNETSGAQVSVKHTARPIVISSPDGTKVVKFAYNTKDTVNNVYADYTCEIVETNTF